MFRLVAFQDIFHIILGAEEDGGPLVDGLGLKVKDRGRASRGETSGLFNDIGHRYALVQQTQLENKQE